VTAEVMIERAGEASRGLTSDEILDLIYYLLWISHYRRNKCRYD